MYNDTKQIEEFLATVTATDFAWNKDTQEHDEVERHVPFTKADDGQIYISAEHEVSYLFADYYGEFRGGYPWINPKLEEGLKAIGFGYYLEWVNPGQLVVVEG